MSIENQIISQFHQLYYNSKIWMNTTWMGTPVQKCPLDLWIYQEIIHETRPDLIIETGTADGGGAHYLASLCDLLQKGRVISVDIIANPDRPLHPRITYLTGSSTAPEILAAIRKMIFPGTRVMVVLDSDHHLEHVLAELRLYSPLVTPGCYLVVEDTNINGHPVFPDYGPGPMEALNHFLFENHQFIIDSNREKLYLTFFPKGFLRRI